MYNEGISVAGDLLDQGVLYGIIAKSGNSYAYEETKLGVGRETARKFLQENQKLVGDIRKKVLVAALKKD